MRKTLKKLIEFLINRSEFIMKKTLISLILLFVFASLTALAQPKIEIEGGDTYNWGVVSQKDSPLKAKVKIFNAGTDTLHVTKVKPGCGCTTAPLDKNKIEPGGFATLDIKLNVSHYSGSISKSIRISSNDPNHSKKTMYIKANIFTPVTISPKYLRMYNLKLNEESASSINLKNNTDKDITIKKIVIKLDGLDLDIEEEAVIPANGNLKVNSKYTPEKDGPFNGSLKFTTDCEELSTINISVRGSVKTKKKGSIKVDSKSKNAEKLINKSKK